MSDFITQAECARMITDALAKQLEDLRGLLRDALKADGHTGGDQQFTSATFHPLKLNPAALSVQKRLVDLTPDEIVQLISDGARDNFPAVHEFPDQITSPSLGAHGCACLNTTKPTDGVGRGGEDDRPAT
ncbi:hypothetical protein [Arthrobacter sp. MA-N2]|uniref:hypothetical protein n=1 Tax=Arthrobacter sp. MA-N2 TaxID=1101188 RepID=UPI0004868BEE|nr:hypothetical protein [Arthrobacter sp. MA-N2]